MARKRSARAVGSNQHKVRHQSVDPADRVAGAARSHAVDDGYLWVSAADLMDLPEDEALDAVEGLKERLGALPTEGQIAAAALFDELAVRHASFQVRCSALESGWVSDEALDLVANDGDVWVRTTAAQSGQWRPWFAEDSSAVVLNAALHNPYCPQDAAERIASNPSVRWLSAEIGAPLPTA